MFDWICSIYIYADKHVNTVDNGILAQLVTKLAQSRVSRPERPTEVFEKSIKT